MCLKAQHVHSSNSRLLNHDGLIVSKIVYLFSVELKKPLKYCDFSRMHVNSVLFRKQLNIFYNKKQALVHVLKM